jgi:hypothetical protein
MHECKLLEFFYYSICIGSLSRLLALCCGRNLSESYVGIFDGCNFFLFWKLTVVNVVHYTYYDDIILCC